MCVRKRVLTEKCGPFDSSIHSADNMQSKNLTFFKHNSNCSQRGMDMSQPQTRMTRQRMVILEELRKVKTHPTADELYAMVRTDHTIFCLESDCRIYIITAGTWNTDSKINSVTFIKILSSSSGNKSSVIHLTYPPTDFS